MRNRALGNALLGLALTCLLISGCARETTERVADPSSQRRTASGEVIGFQGVYDSHVWLGIPYAKPPVAALRWRAPEPPDSWTGTRQALAFGSPCAQYASAFGGVAGAREGEPTGSEDCLYLNVYAPRFAAEQVPTGAARLPVMLWIHGGGNSIGEGAFYNGGNLAATENVVVITFNYRLGPFGWFRNAALRDQSATEDDRSGDFGTLDLIRALQWVRDNAAAFGGNPDNVTIFGESAGGTNVYSLLVSPKARGLFHHAIVESGGFWKTGLSQAENFIDDSPAGDPNSSDEVLTRLLIADKSAPHRGAAKARLAAMTPPQIEDYLRGKSTYEILAAYRTIGSTGMIDMPKVFGDGVVLPTDDPMQRLARGDYNRVPVILGTNRDENKLFMFGQPELVHMYFWFVPRLRNPKQYDLSAEYLARMWKATGADEPAAAMRQVQGPSVYVYRFDWDEEPTMLGADLSEMLGAAHGFEIPFVFGHFDLGKRGNVIFSKANEPGRKTLSGQMMSYWSEFAHTGAPDKGRDGSLPEWKPWDDSSPTSPKFIVFDTPAGGGPRMDAQAVSARAVLASVDTDPRLPTQRDKCMIYHDLAQWSRGFTKSDYPHAGTKGCAEYPFDEFPWGA